MGQWTQQSGRTRLLTIAALCAVSALLLFAGQLRSEAGKARHNAASPAAASATEKQDAPVTPLRGQTAEAAAQKSAGCESCHIHTDEPTTVEMARFMSPKGSQLPPPSINPQSKKLTSSRARLFSRIRARFRSAYTRNG
jgi:hypothetical protein